MAPVDEEKDKKFVSDNVLKSEERMEHKDKLSKKASSEEENKLGSSNKASRQNDSESQESDLQSDTLDFAPINRRSKPRRLKLLILIVSFIVLGGVVFAWNKWAYRLLHSDNQQLPTIRAPKTPIKVRPETPGGIDIPNQDKLVYDRLEKQPPSGKIEVLLPPPEKPLMPPMRETKMNASENEELEKKQTPKGEDVVQLDTLENKSTKEAKLVSEPRRTTEQVKENITSSLKKVQKQGSTINKATNNPTVKISERMPKYQIQLAAVRTRDVATNEWRRLRKKHTMLLSTLKLNVVRVDLGSKGVFYRLRAGFFMTKQEAEIRCKALADVKVNCLVISPRQ